MLCHQPQVVERGQQRRCNHPHITKSNTVSTRGTFIRIFNRFFHFTGRYRVRQVPDHGSPNRWPLIRDRICGEERSPEFLLLLERQLLFVIVPAFLQNHFRTTLPVFAKQLLNPSVRHLAGQTARILPPRAPPSYWTPLSGSRWSGMSRSRAFVACFDSPLFDHLGNEHLRSFVQHFSRPYRFRFCILTQTVGSLNQCTPKRITVSLPLSS